MSSRPSYVILGAGLAGYSACGALRQSGFDGRILLIGDEPVPPYDRPPLSKAYLQGKRQAEDLLYQPLEHFNDLGVELLLGSRVSAVDLAARQLTIEPADVLPFDKLLIATGASPIQLDLPGFDLSGVHYLRSLEHARRLRERIEAASRVLILGGGFIGSEVAASARVLGREVTLVDLLPAPMAGSLHQDLAEIYRRIHLERGVDLRMSRSVAELRGAGQVEEAILDNGEVISCDLVVVGVGVRPEVGLFLDEDLILDNGIVVDEHCETSIPGVYAAGDVANWPHPVAGRLRVEHYDNAALQGAAAGRAMAGQPETYAPVPYFWSDQYDVNLQFVGYPGIEGQFVLRGDPDQPSVTAFSVDSGRVRSAVTINRPRDLRSARRLVESGAQVDPADLANPDIDLRALSRNAAS